MIHGCLHSVDTVSPVTGFDASPREFIFITRGGDAVLFKRPDSSITQPKRGFPQASWISVKSGPLLEVVLHPSVTGVFAVAASSGRVTVFRDDSRITSSRLHLNVRVTALHWLRSQSRQTLVIGDERGTVSILHCGFLSSLVPGILQPTTSHLVCSLDSPVCQLDSYEKKEGAAYLLVSTKNRTFLVPVDSSGTPTPVGSKLRDAECGSCFLTSPDDVDLCLVFCARPGVRLWEADLDAQVRITHQLKEILRETAPVVRHSNSSPQRSLQFLHGFHGPCQQFDDHRLILSNRTPPALYMIDTKLSKTPSWMPLGDSGGAEASRAYLKTFRVLRETGEIFCLTTTGSPSGPTIRHFQIGGRTGWKEVFVNEQDHEALTDSSSSSSSITSRVDSPLQQREFEDERDIKYEKLGHWSMFGGGGMTDVPSECFPILDDLMGEFSEKLIWKIRQKLSKSPSPIPPVPVSSSRFFARPSADQREEVSNPRTAMKILPQAAAEKVKEMIEKTNIALQILSLPQQQESSESPIPTRLRIRLVSDWAKSLEDLIANWKDTRTTDVKLGFNSNHNSDEEKENSSTSSASSSSSLAKEAAALSRSSSFSDKHKTTTTALVHEELDEEVVFSSSFTSRKSKRKIKRKVQKAFSENPSSEIFDFPDRLKSVVTEFVLHILDQPDLWEIQKASSDCATNVSCSCVLSSFVTLPSTSTAVPFCSELLSTVLSDAICKLLDSEKLLHWSLQSEHPLISCVPHWLCLQYSVFEKSFELSKISRNTAHAHLKHSRPSTTQCIRYFDFLRSFFSSAGAGFSNPCPPSIYLDVSAVEILFLLQYLITKELSLNAEHFPLLMKKVLEPHCESLTQSQDRVGSVLLFHFLKNFLLVLDRNQCCQACFRLQIHRLSTLVAYLPPALCQQLEQVLPSTIIRSFGLMLLPFPSRRPEAEEFAKAVRWLAEKGYWDLLSEMALKLSLLCLTEEILKDMAEILSSESPREKSCWICRGNLTPDKSVQFVSFLKLMINVLGVNRTFASLKSHPVLQQQMEHLAPEWRQLLWYCAMVETVDPKLTASVKAWTSSSHGSLLPQPMQSRANSEASSTSKYFASHWGVRIKLSSSCLGCGVSLNSPALSDLVGGVRVFRCGHAFHRLCLSRAHRATTGGPGPHSTCLLCTRPSHSSQ